MTYELAHLSSPVGPLTLAVRNRRLCALVFAESRRDGVARIEQRFGALDYQPSRDPAGVVTALDAYFAGDLEALAPIEVDFDGTVFQHAVWTALRSVGPGETQSYGAIARAIGRPNAVRAVGLANGRNPIAIVVPCHRIIGSDGTLTGYGGGLDRKRWLLAHEQAHARASAANPQLSFRRVS